MRFVIYGIGAIGGTLAAMLSLAGEEVIGIARGRQLQAIREGGLLLRRPEGDQRARLETAASPDEVTFRDDDVILLTMKTQDSAAALDALAAAGLRDQHLFCLQNGVENERLALRRFVNVHGVTVVLPADYVTPGEVAAFGAPHPGYLDIGRYPGGADAMDTLVAERLTAAGLPAFADPQVMASKHGKLLMNLGNIVDAAVGAQDEAKEITARLRAEGEAVFRAAGIDWRDSQDDPRRNTLMAMGRIEGLSRAGSSSAQSLVRGAGSIETAYLNGEIALLARLHGAPAPANAAMVALAQRMLREGLAPGSLAPDDLLAAMEAG
ncbi:ketopantoate reductase family protein [Pseudoroseicyclus aestuarii]|uniref:2-dehydropantoate 2-reductase n=1 Tax=Pseudoroseicyclus aestuarii TaxID=1795041 RepID=A0A318SUR4_9RHOB|nr:2-dehydropantoate 2-reductase N-terminal domain-containing protein [Pseudoroseicyclus aestuarii]PYE84006.1 ketopantoate reductase [Pseudoroseicyclus aestuarii]